MSMKKETGGNYSLGHDKQSKGKSIGVPQKAEHQAMVTNAVVRATSKPLVGVGSFSIKPAKGADGFGYSGAQKQGVMRNSGCVGAHRVGGKKK
jgi:hypothetical protein